MYLYIYTVYVIVEHEMWHFIFEGLFVYFFQNCRKRCYIKAERDDKRITVMVRERVKKINDKKTSWKKPEKGKGESYSTDCI